MTICKRLGLVALVILTAALWLATPTHAQVNPIKLVATTTIIQNIAQNVAGDKLTVDVLVPTNGDVHAFEPKPEDIRKLADADIILMNGAGLERFIEKLIADSGSKAKTVIVSRGLPIRKFGEETTTNGGFLGISGSYVCGAPKEGEELGDCDPHFWQNPTNVIAYTLNIRDSLSEADPANAEAYNTNAGTYMAKLQQLDAEIFQTLASIPAEQRLVVTNHDALGYFAARYGFKVVGVVLPGGSTHQEPDPKQVAELIKTIKAKQVKGIFLENVSSDKLARQIAEESGATIVQALYTDSLGDSGTPGETYLGMMEANLKALSEALK